MGVVWTPDLTMKQGSNLGRFMARLGIREPRDMIERSCADIEWFWREAVEELGIAFSRPFQQVLDASGGIAWTRWFGGGRINLAENCLDRHARGARADHTAIVWEAENGQVRQWTYAELDDAASRFASALLKLGLVEGDRVGLFLPLIPEAVAAFMGCAKMGAVAVPVFSGFAAPAVASRMVDCQARVLVASATTSRRGRELDMLAEALLTLDSAPCVEHLVVIGQPDHRTAKAACRVPIHDWHGLLERSEPHQPARPLDPETPLLIIYTSGTTGAPKGAVHVHGGFLVKIAQEAAHQADMRQSDRICWVTDLGWIMGPWTIVGGLAAGGTIVLIEGVPDYPAPDRLWAIVARHRVSILGVSPTLIRALMKHGLEPVRDHDLSSLRILASTGEPWDPESWRWLFENAGGGRLPIINISGGTEVGACLVSVLPVCPIKPCSVGGPALGMAIDVFDPEGRPLSHGVGELVCTRPWPAMTRGIWGSPERYLATYWSRFPDVWVHGDWASIDEDGFWFLHGRSDDVIKVAGKRIGPAEVESALALHPAVAESAAVPAPDPVKGDEIICLVVPRAGVLCDSALEAELKAHVAHALGKSFRPAHVGFVADLPRTRSGKILRRLIRQAALGLPPGDSSSLENPSALERIAALGIGRPATGGSFSTHQPREDSLSTHQPRED